MIYIKTTHPPGTIGYVTGETPRYYEFTDSLQNTRAPLGTFIARAGSCNVIANCNALVRQMRGDWLWLLGDDHTWNEHLLMRLLDARTDAILPLVCMRRWPYMPVVFKRWRAGERSIYWHWDELHAARKAGVGRLEIAAAGGAGLLVRRHVLEAMRARYGENLFEVPRLGTDDLRDDVYFTSRITETGFKLEVDLRLYMGHLVNTALTPNIDDEHWHIWADLGSAHVVDAHDAEREPLFVQEAAG